MIRRNSYRGLRVRKKICYFCAEKKEADYKDVELLNRFISDQGKILPRRVTQVSSRRDFAFSTLVTLPFGPWNPPV